MKFSMSAIRLSCFSSFFRCVFVGLPFFPSASWPPAFLSLFLSFSLFLRPCLIHARMPKMGRAFVHGHTFLHSWSGSMTVVVGLLHGATFLSGLPLVLFVSFLKPSLSRCNGHPFISTLLPPDLVLFYYLLSSDSLVYDAI